MTSDSQPIELIEGGIRVLDFTGEYRRDKIIERHAGGFDGLIGYVGTETVGAATMRSVLERTNNATTGLALGEFTARLAADLTDLWVQHDLKTCLWVFIAGAAAGDRRFWFVVNGEFVPAGYYVNIRTEFEAVNDLDVHAIPRIAAELGVPATQTSVLALRTLLFRNGAIQQTSYIVKGVAPRDLAATLRQIVEENVYMAIAVPAKAVGGAGGLTERELEILDLVAQGFSNGQIAKQLWVRVATVKFHLMSIFRKLEVSNRTEAGRVAYKLGLVQSPALDAITAA
jgi:DNA-binding CsgD family transcriptional regulator